MIDMTSQMIYRVSNLNDTNQRISYQMSTGKVLENGSDNSVLFARTLNIEDHLRTYEGLQTQIEKTKAQNGVSDSTMSEIKLAVESVKHDLMKALNSGMDVSSKMALATNINGIRENLFSIANTKTNGQYIFAGSDTTKQTFTKDANFATNGKVDFGGDAILRKIAVEPNTYREKGITGFDVLMYNSDTAGAGEQLTFSSKERIIDEDSLEWKLTKKVDTLTMGGTFEANDKFEVTLGGETVSVNADTDYPATAILLKNAIEANVTMSALVDVTIDDNHNVILTAKTVDTDFTTTIKTTESNDGAADDQTFTLSSVPVKLQQYDKHGILKDPEVKIDVTSDGATPPSYTTNVNEITGNKFLEAKHNFFDDLNIMINALNGYSTNTDGTKKDKINSEQADDILRVQLDNSSSQFNASNIGHAELGGRNNIFNIALERIEAKNVHYNILMQETSGADMSKLAMESKSLEMTYQALYSTVAKMHSLSLLNFIK
jgi:flagellar hook-associated protein 3 FlgL